MNEIKPTAWSYFWLIVLLPIILPTILATVFVKIVWFFAKLTWNFKWLS